MNEPDESMDSQARERALDPESSFIVQAPAGSGKTELLIQRFLRLLACVEEPEEVMAVTFTRKAAGEMRTRVIAALRQAEGGEPPAAAHQRRSYDLACAVLRDDRRRDWQLQRHPARLSISTLDSVNAWLAGRAPLHAGSGALQSVTDSPELLYAEAARATLELVAEESQAGEHVSALLRHLDNDAARFERLITAMLPRRDQWLRHVLAMDGDREALEAPLRALTEHGLRRAAACLDEGLATELTTLLAFAARNPGSSGERHVWAGRTTLPQPGADELPAWKALAEALLTGTGDWRKVVNVRNGFPPGTDEKRRMEQLLLDCATRDELRHCLRDVRDLPGAAYQDGQWAVLQAVVGVLWLAAAQLRLAFLTRGQCDFPEMAAAAIAALGGGDAPSELGLALDHRIRHILVDEFQDTSHSQFDLLRRLIEGWEPGDGRTIFLVGDPMQSIYRFRDAEVALFMEVRERGIGGLRPESLRLGINFRSCPQVVRWVNQTFGQTFPSKDDTLLGAVRFAASVAVRTPDSGAGVYFHWLPSGEDRAEARSVANVVRDSLVNGSVCILVRSRAHAVRILPALREAGLAFVAPELESLERASAAQDLLALTRALCSTADRLAWIGVLRAPWCGLSLADLHAVLGTDHDRSVPELLSTGREVLSEDGAVAVARLQSVFAHALAARGRRTLRDLVEGAWLALGGPATLREAEELETAEAFLELLDFVDVGGDCPDPIWLAEQMSRRKGSLGSGNPGVHVMTMHKAKGLEFDTVLLAGLAKPPRGDEPPMLAWQHVPIAPGEAVPVIAPMPPAGGEGDPLHRYLSLLERRKQACEIDRLLYVSCTRARRQLHLFAQLRTSRDVSTGAVRLHEPHSGSLLRHLWVAVAGEAAIAARVLKPGTNREDLSRVWVQPPLRRLPRDWQAPTFATPLLLPPEESTPQGGTALVYEWASSLAMQVGSVVHRWLQAIAEEGLAAFDQRRIESHAPDFRRMLEHLGTAPRDLPRAVGRVVDALTATINDERGRWILSQDHREAASEMSLTVCEGSRCRQIVIDRTFVDDDGCRWIIDYKTSVHQGGDREGFLAVETDRHREQLLRYRAALARVMPTDIRMALYFPLLTAFCEIRPDTNLAEPAARSFLQR